MKSTPEGIKEDHKQKIIGGLLGVCVGDALGVPVEFSSRQERIDNPVTTMQEYGTHNQPAGTWSDDGSLTLCLAEAITKVGFQPQELMQETAKNFCQWYDEDYWTARGNLFDIGGTTADAIANLKAGISPTLAGGKEDYSNGNGSLMRIFPLATGINRIANDDLINLSEQISCLTHAHPRSQIACGIYMMVLMGLFAGKDAIAAYQAAIDQAEARYSERPYVLELLHYRRLFERQIHLLPIDEIRSTGYVIDSLEAAIWCLVNSSSYAETVLKAVNLGGDTDTIAAIAGGLAGVYFGYDSIPSDWLDVLARKDDILALANQLVLV